MIRSLYQKFSVTTLGRDFLNLTKYRYYLFKVRVEVDGTQLPTIPNKIGWLDDVLDRLTEVAFCLTDFGEYKRKSRL